LQRALNGPGSKLLDKNNISFRTYQTSLTSAEALLGT